MGEKKALLLMILLLCSAEGVHAEKTSLWESGKLVTGKRDLGLIFNTGDLLLDLESYQGGVGAKIGVGNFILRPVVDILLNTGINPFSLTLGTVLEMHVLPGPVSVYWGPSLQTGFTIITTTYDEANWTQTIAIELISAACVLGVEIFVFDFLSFFIEYSLGFTFGLNIDRSSVFGTLSSASKFSYNFDVGLGNSGMIGVVFYLKRKDRK